jgi:hypothetical protein
METTRCCGSVSRSCCILPNRPYGGTRRAIGNGTYPRNYRVLYDEVNAFVAKEAIRVTAYRMEVPFEPLLYEDDPSTSRMTRLPNDFDLPKMNVVAEGEPKSFWPTS